MLGVYANFPESVHGISRFAASVSNKKLQHILTETFHMLNNQTLNLEEVASPSMPQCTLAFEFGIAEDSDFNYLDNEEKQRVLKSVNKKPLQVIDFLCAIRYYKKQGEKKVPLRFDYYLLRFAFNKDLFEMRVFHERGPMHILPKDVTEFVYNKINGTSSKRILKPYETY
jgi:hypothetical protein